MVVIDRFEGGYAFLSNFYPVAITVSVPIGGGYSSKFDMPSVEHAYQAMKCADRPSWERIYQAETPGKAKRLGRTVQSRQGWDGMKVSVMRDLLTQKFQYPPLEALLLQTRHAIMIEGNDWGDRFWGQVDGEGENWLGRLLMMVRDSIAIHQMGRQRLTRGT